MKGLRYLFIAVPIILTVLYGTIVARIDGDFVTDSDFILVIVIISISIAFVLIDIFRTIRK